MIRKAKIDDIQPIYELLQTYGEKGELLPRPLSELYDHLRDFSVYADDEGRVLGCCALQICWQDLAEIRSLAVQPEFTGKKLGGALVEEMLQEAVSLQIRKVFTLTYRPDFFAPFGFGVVDRSELPLKIWGGCLLCVKFPDCDETAMMKEIAG